MDKYGLWFKVLGVKYGTRDGRILSGERKVLGWWKDLLNVREGVGLNNSILFEDKVRKMG